MAASLDSSPVAFPRDEKFQVSVDDAEVSREALSTIPSKYRGTITDYKDMRVLGKTQRNFKFFTMLGFASSLMCSWEYLLALVVFGLTNGGTALIFWGFIVVAIGMTLVYMSLAELASMSPTAGGQYHWVSELTSPAWQKPLSYVVGWLTTIGWLVYLCGATFVAATIIQGLIVLNVENYVWHNWHGTLLTIGIIFGAVFFNTVLGTRLPFINGSFLVLHFAGFAAVVVTLWVVGEHADSSVLLEFRNDGGWPATGLSAMVGLITPLSVIVGFDCSAHMSEEIQDASITLPRVMMSSALLNIVMTFVMAVTVIFTVGSIDEILDTATGQPFVQLFYNITQSYAATNVLTTIIIVMLFGSSISQVAATSRQLWSFARDGGVPAAAWVSKVKPGWDLPLPAVSISIFTGSLLACINLGSSTALNAIISLGLVSVLTSYLVTLGCLIWRRLFGLPLPARRWSLGKYGLAINIAAIIFLLPVWVFMFWPSVVPVTAVTMNWSSTIFCSLMMMALVYYAIRGRHVYCGPVTHVNRTD